MYVSIQCWFCVAVGNHGLRAEQPLNMPGEQLHLRSSTLPASCQAQQQAAAAASTFTHSLTVACYVLLRRASS